MQLRTVFSKENISAITHIIPDTAKNLWEGFPEDNSNHNIWLSMLNAYGIMTMTSTSPLVAACIAAIGLKRFGYGTYQLGSSLYTLFTKKEDLDEEELEINVKHKIV